MATKEEDIKESEREPLLPTGKLNHGALGKIEAKKTARTLLRETGMHTVAFFGGVVPEGALMINSGLLGEDILNSWLKESLGIDISSNFDDIPNALIFTVIILFASQIVFKVNLDKIKNFDDLRQEVKELSKKEKLQNTIIDSATVALTYFSVLGTLYCVGLLMTSYGIDPTIAIAVSLALMPVAIWPQLGFFHSERQGFYTATSMTVSLFTNLALTMAVYFLKYSSAPVESIFKATKSTFTVSFLLESIVIGATRKNLWMNILTFIRDSFFPKQATELKINQNSASSFAVFSDNPNTSFYQKSEKTKKEQEDAKQPVAVVIDSDGTKPTNK